MTLWVGTSGYQYPEWKGSFYPQKMPPARMLRFYAEHFATVEINYTFYRMPNEQILAGWNNDTPQRFRLTLKAPKRITHDARLRNCAEAVQRFLAVASTLGNKLGALLFQLPPYLRKDIALLDDFLALLPATTRAAFEFRHTSWMEDEVYDRLQQRNLALCIADGEKVTAPVRMTADFAYFRLRDEGYQPADISRWAQVIREQALSRRDVFVYFKHEEAGKGPEFARLLLAELPAEAR